MTLNNIVAFPVLGVGFMKQRRVRNPLPFMRPEPAAAHIEVELREQPPCLHNVGSVVANFVLRWGRCGVEEERAQSRGEIWVFPVVPHPGLTLVSPMLMPGTEVD